MQCAESTDGCIGEDVQRAIPVFIAMGIDRIPRRSDTVPPIEQQSENNPEETQEEETVVAKTVIRTVLEPVAENPPKPFSLVDTAVNSIFSIFSKIGKDEKGKGAWRPRGCGCKGRK